MIMRNIYSTTCYMMHLGCNVVLTTVSNQPTIQPKMRMCAYEQANKLDRCGES